MLEFNPADPFPLITNCPYDEQKAHAVRVDEWLGLQTEAVEHLLKSKTSANKTEAEPAAGPREFWIGKPVQTFSTPYTELRAIAEELRPREGQTLFDLGAGYGRMAHVLARHFPRTTFVGYEFVLERQLEAARVIECEKLFNARVIHGDAAQIDFRIHSADFYFMYDFGSREDVEMCVENLKIAASTKPITVVGRGGRSRDIVEKQHPWLSQVVSPVHRDHYSIYRSAED
ncbi:hypothetical protein BH10BDE1_BH10BDE1_31750 [soil metagenome]